MFISIFNLFKINILQLSLSSPRKRGSRKKTLKTTRDTKKTSRKTSKTISKSTQTKSKLLKSYKEKRNLKTSGEPKALIKPSKTLNIKKKYIIQKHAARHLHYDLRLELQGVLKSWAVPKGPSLDPDTKRLAVEVEDHPLSYANFEGTIPENHYGAGTVLLWDRGTWVPPINPVKAYEKGDLTFELKGKKLHGLWKLIKIQAKETDKNIWLFFKLKDKFSNKKENILEKEPLSVKSKKTLEAIREGRSKIWNSTRKKQSSK